MSKRRKEDGHKRRKSTIESNTMLLRMWRNPCCRNLKVNAGENLGAGQHMLSNLTHARSWACVYPNLRYKKEAIPQRKAVRNYH